MGHCISITSRRASRALQLGLLLGLSCLWLMAEAVAIRNVRDFGVAGDGANVETAAIQGAIDACAVNGGCTLTFPAGRYLTGTLFLRDSITLHLAPGAVLLASSRASDYPAPALIYGKGLDTVAITGPGEVQAGPVPAPDETTIRNPGSRLVSLVLLENCANVRIQDIRLRRSPAFTISLRVVDSAWINNVSIENALLAPALHGVVLDSSSRVQVRGLQYRGGGDGIVIQTGLVEGVAPPAEHIAISDSTLESGGMALRVGTRTHAPIRNVVVSNLVILRSQGGIGVFVRDGATVENLQFSNTVIETRAVHRDTVEWPLVLDLKRRSEDSQAGILRGVRFHNTTVSSAGRILFSGFPSHPIRDVQFQGLDL
nr:glycosyl hydrolase family 28 protein [Bryobacterales bacterium]